MAFALTILSIGSLFSGYLLKDSFVGVGSCFWGNSIFKLEFNTIGLDLEFIPLFIKNIPLFFSSFGMLLGIMLNLFLSLFRSKYIFFANNIIVSYPQYFVDFLWFFFHK